METPAIETRNLCKKFNVIGRGRGGQSSEEGRSGDTVTALDNVSLSIPRGSVCGLLGPNGAGKTTLLRIISSVIAKDSGDVRIFGEEASQNITRRLLGYMPEERGLYPNMKVGEQIAYFARLHGADKERIGETIDRYLELFNLSDDKNRRTDTLSKGNQQKIQIIATLAHEPEIVILDEPFSGFDPINASILTGLMDHLRSQGTTLILSSHNMPAIEQACDDILLIDHGRLLLEGNVNEIRRRHADGSLTFTTTDEVDLETLRPFVSSIEKRGEREGAHTYIASLCEGVRAADLITAVAGKSDIIRFERHLPSLTDIFIKYSTQKDTPK